MGVAEVGLVLSIVEDIFISVIPDSPKEEREKFMPQKKLIKVFVGEPILGGVPLLRVEVADV